MLSREQANLEEEVKAAVDEEAHIEAETTLVVDEPQVKEPVK